MLVFLLIYLTLYLLVHYYAWRKLRPLLPAGGFGRGLVAGSMALMILAPIIVRLAERAGIEIGARLLAEISFGWMGLLFLFFCLSVLADLIGGLRFGWRRLRQRPGGGELVSARGLVVAQLLLCLGIYGYGLNEARTIRTEHLLVTSPKLPVSLGRLRIVQISDVHLGLLVRSDRLAGMLAAVRAAQPDILVATGDLVDGQLNNLSAETRMLAELRPRLAKLAITGNHEFYAGLDKSLALLDRAGFTVLRHQALQLGDLVIAGLDDYGHNSRPASPDSAAKLLAGKDASRFILLLKHRPDVEPGTAGRFDLQLSGHTHKGQIFPFNLLTWLFHPYRAGQPIEVGSGYLYVKRGTGTWGPPIRFLAPPEVTVIDLVHGEAATVQVGKTTSMSGQS